jgi:RNA polymerase sigma factor (sigma-70 family)
MTLKNNQESMEEDFATVRKLLAGDNSAFSNLGKKYKRYVSYLIRKMVQNEEDVEDLTQETFIKAYNAMDTFQFCYSFSSWIYKIASNNCIDFLRKKRFPTVSLSQPIFEEEDDYFLQIEDNGKQPDVEFLAKERQKAVRAAIEKLPENYREIIKLRHEHELDYTEIVEQLGIPIGTVKANLFRARKLLLTELKKSKSLFVDY